VLTDAKPSEWLIYRPPKSVSFGHQARVRDARRAWTLVDDFLKLHTDFVPGHHLIFTCYRAAEQADAMIAAAKAILGAETSANTHRIEWKIRPEQLSKAIALSLDAERTPEQAKSADLSIHFSFTWKNWVLPSAPNEPRDRWSTLGVIIHAGSVFLQPTFVFPAAYDSASLRAYLTVIEPSLPFRFRDQYFQRWLFPVGQNSSGRTRKLNKNWRFS
jgi:hypothetical protein